MCPTIHRNISQEKTYSSFVVDFLFSLFRPDDYTLRHNLIQAQVDEDSR